MDTTKIYETFASLSNQLDEVAKLETADTLNVSVLEFVIQELTRFTTAKIENGMVLLAGKPTKKIPAVKFQAAAKMLSIQLENNVDQMLGITLDQASINGMHGNIFIMKGDEKY